jgi:hypothetical protein
MSHPVWIGLFIAGHGCRFDILFGVVTRKTVLTSQRPGEFHEVYFAIINLQQYMYIYIYVYIYLDKYTVYINI